MKSLRIRPVCFICNTSSLKLNILLLRTVIHGFWILMLQGIWLVILRFYLILFPFFLYLSVCLLDLKLGLVMKELFLALIYCWEMCFMSLTWHVIWLPSLNCSNNTLLSFCISLIIPVWYTTVLRGQRLDRVDWPMSLSFLIGIDMSCFYCFLWFIS